VQSPEPYQRVTVSSHLIKTQALAAAYKTQLELASLLGDIVVRPDLPSNTAGISPYQLSNTAINTVSALKFDGTDDGWRIVMSAIYYINSNYWSS
jgi:hypothetical protein